MFIEHRQPSRLETNTVIDGGNHRHKLEAIANMYASVAGEIIKIDNIPLVPTFEPNVLSHGRLKESGVEIRLDATPPYMTIKGVKIILTAHKYVYYFIAYPAHAEQEEEEQDREHTDTHVKPERDMSPFSVHAPSTIWALWTTNSTSERFKSLKQERKRVELLSESIECETQTSSTSCTFKDSNTTRGRVTATIAAVALRSSRPAPPALLTRNKDGTMAPRETPDMPRGMPTTWLLIHQMFGHCNNSMMRATCANYGIACPRKGDATCIACDVIGIRSSPTYSVSRSGSSLHQADRKLVWMMDISGPYPTAPDGARYLLPAANNTYNFVWICGLARKSDAAKSLAAFAATFDAIGLKPKCIISTR